MMKRKLALLLAAIMTVAAVPSTLFAATSENHLTKSGLNVPDYTLFYEQGYVTGNGGGGTVTDNSEKIEYWVDGSNLVIELKDAIPEGVVNGGVFKISLDNAKWFFRTSDVTPVTVAVGGPKQITATVAEELMTRYGSSAVPADNIFTKTAGTPDVYSAVSKADITNFSGGGLPTGFTTSTFNPTGAVYNDYKYFRLNTPATEAQYVMEVSRADASSATVTVLGNAAANNRIVIPLVVRTTGVGADTRVSITESNTFVSRNQYLLASGRTGRTTTSATGTVTSRTDFLLEDIVIREQRFGSIKKDSSFELTAPSGYYFDISKTDVYTELGLSWGTTTNSRAGLGVQSTTTTTPYDNDYYMRYRERNNRVDRSTLVFTFQNINPSTNIAGSIFIRDLLLVAEDPDTNLVTGKELALSIRDISTTTANKSFTDESFTVGKVSDYIVKLTRVEDKIPELVSGRLDSYTTILNGVYDSPLGITDEHHKAAVVKVEESIPNAWWAERTTELTLPQGVRILKAQFTNLTNIDTDSTAAITANANSFSGKDFYNTGTRENGVITIKDNELLISRLKVTDTTKKANFRLALWLNIDVAFEGDIDLSLSGSAITNAQDVSAVTIAKAIKPVEVLTKVTDIKVGYQYITVADFEIVETKAGNLQQGETVYVSVTDEISVDMNIAKGFTASVTDGDLKISNITTRSALGTTGENIDGQVRFDIDRSSAQASTIKFSNVQVKVDNSVPQSNLSLSNERGINLVVWGSAIAQNYEGLVGTARTAIGTSSGARLSTRDFFATPGIRAKYINIGTPASGGNSSLTNVVSVSIGNPVISVGEEQYTMPVAAYVSTASNSTMVPVRFVAYALGLAEGNVIWDPANGTVTVNTASRIVQFQIGNTNYLANGVSVPMISPDGLPVAAEIRDERAFIPFRALGESLGIPITWHEATSTAVYNAPTVQ